MHPRRDEGAQMMLGRPVIGNLAECTKMAQAPARLMQQNQTRPRSAKSVSPAFSPTIRGVTESRVGQGWRGEGARACWFHPLGRCGMGGRAGGWYRVLSGGGVTASILPACLGFGRDGDISG